MKGARALHIKSLHTRRGAGAKLLGFIWLDVPFRTVGAAVRAGYQPGKTCPFCIALAEQGCSPRGHPIRPAPSVTSAPSARIPSNAPAPYSAAAAAAALWMPTHEMKERANGWAQPDPNTAVIGTVDERLPMRVVGRRDDWAHIECSNGWCAWIDGRRLKAR